MSFIVRMRYCPDSDSCQVVIQPHYSASGEYDEEVREEILLPLAQTIRATLGAKVSRRTCAYISASSTMDQDNLADLFILYFFAGEEVPGTGTRDLGDLPDEPGPPHLRPRDGGDRRRGA
jgi:hypothetical protein